MKTSYMKQAILSALLLATSTSWSADIDQGVVNRFTIAPGAKSVPISTAASDVDDEGNPGTVTQRLYINGALKATVTDGTMVFNWNVRVLKPGAHEIKVVATDAKGNSNTLRAIATKE